MANVVPGYSFTSASDPLTFTKLNLLGQPTVSLGAGEVVPSNISPSGIGYAAGAGGTVTQLTSKATTFVLSKACGQIITAGDILNAGTIVSCTWTNTLFGAYDTVKIDHKSGGTIGAYTFNVACGAGTGTFYIRNATAGNLTEALTLNFFLLKGVVA